MATAESGAGTVQLSDAPVPVHPETVDDDPRSIRWVVPTGVLTARGIVSRAPGDLGTLLGSGEITRMTVAADAVTIRLADGYTWSSSGPRVRTALGQALHDPEGWTATDAPVEGAEAVLREVALAVIAGEAGDYVRSHGGSIALAGVGEGCVDVRLTGACGHCPAAGATLRHRVETAIRARYPDLVAVRQVA